MLARLTSELSIVWFPDVPAATRAPQVVLRIDDEPLKPPCVVFGAGRIEARESGLALLIRHPTGARQLSLSFPDVVEYQASLEVEFGLRDLVARFGQPGRVELLRHLLETVPLQFRINGAGLSNANRVLLDLIEVTLPPVKSAFSIGDGQTLLCCSIANVTASRGAYRLGPHGVVRVPGPIDVDGDDAHWLLESIGPDAAGETALVGIEGREVWHLRLNDIRPGGPDLLLRYLDALDPGRSLVLVQAMQRWAAIGTGRVSDQLIELLEDCRVFFAAGGRDVEGKPVKPLGWGIGQLVAVPGGAAFVHGWVFDPHNRVDRIELVDATGKGHAVPCLWPVLDADAASRWTRAGFPAPERAGFVGYVSGGVDGPWSARVVLKGGARLDVPVPASDPDPRRARDAILLCVSASAEIDGAITDVIAPAVDGLHAAHMARYPAVARGAAQFRIGPAVEKPRATVIIPLYSNLNFLGFQQAAFARDPGFSDVEIIYVLDSPEQAGFLEGRLRGEYLIYGISVTVVVHPVNLGFSAAVNTGARLARAPLLVLLNSDAIPEEAGWLDPLLAKVSQEDVGLVGPKLLYLDESLQFAGMYFDRDSDGVWYNRHIAKGYPRDHPLGNQAREIPVATGACLAIRRSVFERIGGFDEEYVIGDFEDSDLCLRIRETGLSCWYEPASVLYHIERQSVDRHAAHHKSVATMVNRWRQQRHWDKVITALMADGERRWSIPKSLAPKVERLA